MMIKHVIPAEQYGTFAAGSWDSSIDKDVPLNLPDGAVSIVHVLDAEVSEDGKEVTLTLDVDDSLRHFFEGGR